MNQSTTNVDQVLLDKEELCAGGLMTTLEVATFLKISRSQTINLLKAGTLPRVKIRRSTRIPRNAVLQYLAKNMVNSDS